MPKTYSGRKGKLTEKEHGVGPQKTPVTQDSVSQEAWDDRCTQSRVPATRTERDKGGLRERAPGAEGKPAWHTPRKSGQRGIVSRRDPRSAEKEGGGQTWVFIFFPQ